ncbi:hypothetical protein JJV70_02510 [Streptomyces sp. JJ66]|uniref:glycine-rich domain-containing protein n=1 Tax=Streptomyces sp. JJ66 TaxID=2803843 RepID=UPI001C566EB0|nr:hypothetical protein [Streptomyces sp. JJ66]MBW1600994.1 hypothetical protein [Streptomyces sp. JJ66]
MDTRTLLTNDQFADVVATVLDNNDGMEELLARRIVGEAVRFVATAARYPTVAITPSRVVDEGWHALILHTALYTNLCAQLGRFVHHYPERPEITKYDKNALTRTTALMEEAGYSIDHELWAAPTKALIPVAANCQHLPKPGGCGPIRPGSCASHCSGGSSGNDS